MGMTSWCGTCGGLIGSTEGVAGNPCRCSKPVACAPDKEAAALEGWAGALKEVNRLNDELRLANLQLSEKQNAYDIACNRIEAMERGRVSYEREIEELQKDVAGLKNVDIPTFQNQLGIANRLNERYRKALEKILENDSEGSEYGIAKQALAENPKQEVCICGQVNWNADCKVHAIKRKCEVTLHNAVMENCVHKCGYDLPCPFHPVVEQGEPRK